MDPTSSEGVSVASTDEARPVEEHPCAERNCLLASAVLVDRRGWLLLQERDEHAPVAPDQWALVGGHLDPGEAWEDGLRRELAEETGLTDVEGFELWFDEVVQHSPKVSSHLADHWKIWVAAVDLTDDDIVCGEGRQIVFVDPAQVRSGSIDLAAGARHVLPLLLDSPTYAKLR
ncbi:MAG TPA: NUDIX hydrolase [Marmoricola sp.]|nr:NUDIX hydrolase [Marmoricola sp.]